MPSLSDLAKATAGASVAVSASAASRRPAVRDGSGCRRRASRRRAVAVR